LGNEKEMIPVEKETVKIEALYDNGKRSRTMEYKIVTLLAIIKRTIILVI
jgi:hypothetical protein